MNAAGNGGSSRGATTLLLNALIVHSTWLILNCMALPYSDKDLLATMGFGSVNDSSSVLSMSKTYYYYGERATITCKLNTTASVPYSLNFTTSCARCPVISNVLTPATVNGSTVVVTRTLVFNVTSNWAGVYLRCVTNPLKLQINRQLAVTDRLPLATAMAAARTINYFFNPASIQAIPTIYYRETAAVVNSLRYNGPFAFDILGDTLETLMLRTIKLLQPVRGIISPYSGRVLPLIISAFNRNSDIASDPAAMAALAMFVKQIATAKPWLNAKAVEGPSNGVSYGNIFGSSAWRTATALASITAFNHFVNL